MSRPFDPEKLDELVRRVVDVLPEGAGTLEREVRSTLRSVLGAALERMDLVSREEFDVQQAVLERTRDKLERLERTVAELEARLGHPQGRLESGPKADGRRARRRRARRSEKRREREPYPHSRVAQVAEEWNDSEPRPGRGRPLERSGQTRAAHRNGPRCRCSRSDGKVEAQGLRCRLPWCSAGLKPASKPLW